MGRSKWREPQLHRDGRLTQARSCTFFLPAGKILSDYGAQLFHLRSIPPPEESAVSVLRSCRERKPQTPEPSAIPERPGPIDAERGGAEAGYAGQADAAGAIAPIDAKHATRCEQSNARGACAGCSACGAGTPQAD